MENSGVWRTKTLKRGKIGPRFLLSINRMSHTRFQSVQKTTTLDDLEGSLIILYTVSKHERHGVVSFFLFLVSR